MTTLINIAPESFAATSRWQAIFLISKAAMRQHGRSQAVGFDQGRGTSFSLLVHGDHTDGAALTY
jgi:hypothetical protein